MAKIKKQLMIIIPMIFMMLCFCKIDVSAHDAYFLSITIDESTYRYHGEIVHETSDNHREVDVGGFSKAVEDHAMTAEIPKVDDDSAEDVYPVDKKGTNDILYYTFSSIHSQGGMWWWKESVDGGDNDLALAQRVVDYPLGGLNDAISFILTQTGWRKSSGSKTDFIEIARNLGNYNNFTVTVGGTPYEVTIEKSPGGTNAKPLSIGIKADDYCKITVNGKSEVFIYRCKKGYYNDDENDPLYYMKTSQYDKVKPKFEKNGDVEYMDWKMFVMQGNYNRDIKGATYSSQDKITQPNEFDTLLTRALGNMITGIRSMLGLYSINDLMTNSGSRDRNYTLGLYPASWSSSIILLHVICQMIAWGCIGFAILKLVYKRQLATMNVVEKVAWQESLKNLILCGFLLAAFTLVFNLFARFNYRLVDLFTATTTLENFDSFFKFTSSGMITGSFGQIAVSAANLILTTYFNFFYFLRGITIAVLYGLSPLAIYTLSLGGKMSGVFSNFMKELFGNIFIQTIHAILIAFFCNVTVSTSPRMFEMLIILYSFIPISKFVKEKLFGMSGGLDGAASGLMKTASSVAGGVAGGIMGSKAASKGGGGNGSGGGSSTDSPISQSMDSTLNQAKSAADVSLKDNNDSLKSKIKHNPISETARNVNDAINHSKHLSNAKTIGTAVAKTAGNLAMGAGAIGGGAVLSAIDPSTGAKLAGAGAGRLGNIRNDLGNVPGQIKANDNFATSLAYNGAKAVHARDDFTTYDVAGEFNPDTGHLNNNDMSVAQRHEYEAMYNATKYGQSHDLFGVKDEDLNDTEKKYKQTLNRMAKNQVRMDISSDGTSAKIVRRSADINSLKNPIDRANPLAGTSQISDRSDNRNEYYHDPKSRM